MAGKHQDDAVYLTKSGLKELKAEHEELTKTKKPHLINRVSEAREQGDLSENSDYSAAKDELELVNNRIDELTEILEKAQIIKSGKGKKTVKLGNSVTIKKANKEITFTLVGEWEADPNEKKISQESPLGQAVLGRKAGDTVEVDAPAGKITYTVEKIQ